MKAFSFIRLFRSVSGPLGAAGGPIPDRIDGSGAATAMGRAGSIVGVSRADGRLFGIPTPKAFARTESEIVPRGEKSPVVPSRFRASRPVGDERNTPLNLPELRRFVTVSEPVSAGDVLVLDRSRRGQMRCGDIPGDSAVIGVVSSDAGSMTTRAAVTVSGLVTCKVDAAYGPIRPGDSLTVSPTRGHAMHSQIHAPGAILGRAIEPLSEGRGLIKVIVTLR